MEALKNRLQASRVAHPMDCRIWRELMGGQCAIEAVEASKTSKIHSCWLAARRALVSHGADGLPCQKNAKSRGFNHPGRIESVACSTSHAPGRQPGGLLAPSGTTEHRPMGSTGKVIRRAYCGERPGLAIFITLLSDMLLTSYTYPHVSISTCQKLLQVAAEGPTSGDGTPWSLEIKRPELEVCI